MLILKYVHVKFLNGRDLAPCGDTVQREEEHVPNNNLNPDIVEISYDNNDYNTPEIINQSKEININEQFVKSSLDNIITNTDSETKLRRSERSCNPPERLDL